MGGKRALRVMIGKSCLMVLVTVFVMGSGFAGEMISPVGKEPAPVPVAAAAPVPVPVAAVPPPLAALPPASTEDQREYVRSVCAELFRRDTRDLGGHTPGQDCGETTVEAVAAVIGTGLRAAEFAAAGLVGVVLWDIRTASVVAMTSNMALSASPR